jgi:hypothetical protein
VFESLIVIPDQAWKEIFEKLMTHTVKEHPEFYQVINQEATIASATVVSYVLVSKLAKTVEPNKWLEEHMSKIQDTIMGIVGYDRVNDEEEEEEEDTEDTEDNMEDTEEEEPVYKEPD